MGSPQLRQAEPREPCSTFQSWGHKAQSLLAQEAQRPPEHIRTLHISLPNRRRTRASSWHGQPPLPGTPNTSLFKQPGPWASVAPGRPPCKAQQKGARGPRGPSLAGLPLGPVPPQSGQGSLKGPSSLPASYLHQRRLPSQNHMALETYSLVTLSIR